MSWNRCIQVRPFQGSSSPPIAGRSLSSICVDINTALDQDARRYLTSPRLIWLNDKVTLSPSLSPKFRILSKTAGCRAENPKIFKLGSSKIQADETERKSRKLQNYLCLQVLDGETKMLERNAQTEGSKTSLDIILEQEKDKRKCFKFPEEGKFKTEDEMLELSENDFDEQKPVVKNDLSQQNVKLYRDVVLDKDNL